mmetsp:Transcript_36862/g.102298  ORF Transcript_36862/g.102298 Transcript_36862/m.102298 type:complete len:257 (-) Transcript_36862:144-914(-)
MGMVQSVDCWNDPLASGGSVVTCERVSVNWLGKGSQEDWSPMPVSAQTILDSERIDPWSRPGGGIGGASWYRDEPEECGYPERVEEFYVHGKRGFALHRYESVRREGTPYPLRPSQDVAKNLNCLGPAVSPKRFNDMGPAEPFDEVAKNLNCSQHGSPERNLNCLGPGTLPKVQMCEDEWQGLENDNDDGRGPVGEASLPGLLSPKVLLELALEGGEELPAASQEQPEFHSDHSESGVPAYHGLRAAFRGEQLNSW